MDQVEESPPSVFWIVVKCLMVLSLGSAFRVIGRALRIVRVPFLSLFVLPVFALLLVRERVFMALLIPTFFYMSIFCGYVVKMLQEREVRKEESKQHRKQIQQRLREEPLQEVLDETTETIFKFPCQDYEDDADDEATATVHDSK